MSNPQDNSPEKSNSAPFKEPGEQVDLNIRPDDIAKGQLAKHHPTENHSPKVNPGGSNALPSRPNPDMEATARIKKDILIKTVGGVVFAVVFGLLAALKTNNVFELRYFFAVGIIILVLVVLIAKPKFGTGKPPVRNKDRNLY